MKVYRILFKERLNRLGKLLNNFYAQQPYELFATYYYYAKDEFGSSMFEVSAGSSSYRHAYINDNGYSGIKIPSHEEVVRKYISQHQAEEIRIDFEGGVSTFDPNQMVVVRTKYSLDHFTQTVINQYKIENVSILNLELRPFEDLLQRNGLKTLGLLSSTEGGLIVIENGQLMSKEEVNYLSLFIKEYKNTRIMIHVDRENSLEIFYPKAADNVSIEFFNI